MGKKLVLVLLCVCGVGVAFLQFRDRQPSVSDSTIQPNEKVGLSGNKGEAKGDTTGVSVAAKSSVIVKKVESGEQGQVVVGPRKIIPERASPMDRPSADELKRFPTAKVMMDHRLPIERKAEA